MSPIKLHPALVPTFAAVLSLVFIGCRGGEGGPGGDAPELGDVSARVERVGNPYEAYYGDGEWVYARNLWDLKAFGGRLYLGAGNSSNEGPAVNAGPVPLIAYDPKLDAFVEETLVEDEQIDVYYAFGGRLFTPGHDPREGWLLGNVYRLGDNGRWVKRRALPLAIHAYAMAEQAGRLFAGLGTVTGGAVASSTDSGETWTTRAAPGYRVHAFLEVGGELYATGIFPAARSGPLGFTSVSEHTFGGRFEGRPDLGIDAMFPGRSHTPGSTARVVTPAALGEKVVYIGGHVHNDHQFLPFGLYVAESPSEGGVNVRTVPLPSGGAPWDVTVRDGTVHALVNTEKEGAWRVSVLASSDLSEWTEILHFEAPTIARSLEQLDGAFYFGLGTEIADPDAWELSELNPAAGDLLRVRVGASSTRDSALPAGAISNTIAGA